MFIILKLLYTMHISVALIFILFLNCRRVLCLVTIDVVQAHVHVPTTDVTASHSELYDFDVVYYFYLFNSYHSKQDPLHNQFFSSTPST